MNSWIYDDDDYDADDIFGDESDEYDIGDDYEELMYKEMDKWYFEGKPRHGKFAHAYAHNIDNVRIIQMREKGKSLREIAAQFDCSPSTIRNRLKKMGCG